MIDYSWTIVPNHSTNRVEDGVSKMKINWVLTGILDGNSYSVMGSDDITYNPLDFIMNNYVTVDTIKNTVESGLGEEKLNLIKLEIKENLSQ